MLGINIIYHYHIILINRVSGCNKNWTLNPIDIKGPHSPERRNAAPLMVISWLGLWLRFCSRFVLSFDLTWSSCLWTSWGSLTFSNDIYTSRRQAFACFEPQSTYPRSATVRKPAASSFFRVRLRVMKSIIDWLKSIGFFWNFAQSPPLPPSRLTNHVKNMTSDEGGNSIAANRWRREKVKILSTLQLLQHSILTLTLNLTLTLTLTSNL